MHYTKYEERRDLKIPSQRLHLVKIFANDERWNVKHVKIIDTCLFSFKSLLYCNHLIYLCHTNGIYTDTCSDKIP